MTKDQIIFDLKVAQDHVDRANRCENRICRELVNATKTRDDLRKELDEYEI